MGGFLVTAAGGTRPLQPSVHVGSFRPCEESVKAAVHAERSSSLRPVLRSCPAAVLRPSPLSRPRGHDAERSAREFHHRCCPSPSPHPSCCASPVPFPAVCLTCTRSVFEK